MKIKTFNNVLLEIVTREKGRNLDEDVIAEVISGDCYWLRKMGHFNPKVLLDIGGHIGCWGVYAKSLFPDARLIAVEPNVESYELYKQNAEINKLTNYEIINAAVEYDESRHILLHGGGGGQSAAGCTTVTEEEAEEINKRVKTSRIAQRQVALVTIEELLKDIGRVDISKWDSEGAELRAFANMLPETRDKFEILVGEYHTHKSNQVLKKELNLLFPNHHVKLKCINPTLWTRGMFRIVREP